MDYKVTEEQFKELMRLTQQANRKIKSGKKERAYLFSRSVKFRSMADYKIQLIMLKNFLKEEE